MATNELSAMRERQARYSGICPVRERIYANVFDELIASVARNEAKRGSVLRRVNAEARMSIDAYRTVFEGSIDFGGRKLTQAVERKGQLAETIESLEAQIATLTAEGKHQLSLCEGLEHREEVKAKAYEAEDKEIADLQAEQQQLKDLLVVLRLSKPEGGGKGGK